MMNNPFTSKQFTQIWLKHFHNSKLSHKFDSINHVEFIKTSWLNYYVNVGKNLTKGIYYVIDESKSDFRNKIFLIYDVPEYFDVPDVSENSRLKVKKVFQYQGFLMNLKGYENAEDYINSRFSGKNRREFRSNQRRLETCFNVRYQFFDDQIEKAQFSELFDQFHELLVNRFTEKQTDYHHLESDKWQYYSELVYEMINAKKASLLVIYKDEKPIGITLNFHDDNILFETITVFDPDYYKFSIGKTSIIKLLDWCFNNGVQISDFSKGDFDYKRKWANEIYDFNYHILYDSKSLISSFKANVLSAYFSFKSYLRKKKMNRLYRRLRFILGSNRHTSQKEKRKFKIENCDLNQDFGGYQIVNYGSTEYEFLKKFVFTFLFANPEKESNINVSKHPDSDTFVIKGSKKVQKIIFS